MRDRARNALIKIGVLPNLEGYHYLLEAVTSTTETVLQNKIPSYTKLNEQIAEKYGTTPSAVERAMRYTVSRVKQCNGEPFQKLFKPYKKNRLTVSLFVSMMTEYILSRTEE